MIGALNTVNIASAAFVDQDVESWVERVSSAGGAVKQSTIEAVSNFIISLKKNNVRNKIRRCNLFCGEDLITACTPTIISEREGGSTFGNSRDTRIGFTSADYSELNGLSATDTVTTQTATKYLETGLHITSAGVHTISGHIAHMTDSIPKALSSLANAGNYLLPLHAGDYDDDGDASAFIEWREGSTFAPYIYAGSASAMDLTLKSYVESVVATDDISGLWIANRSSTTSQRLYNDNVAVDDGTSTGDQSANNPKILVGGYKFRIFAAWSTNLGANIQTNSHKIMFYSLGKGLATNELTALYDAVTEFNKNIGRT